MGLGNLLSGLFAGGSSEPQPKLLNLNILNDVLPGALNTVTRLVGSLTASLSDLADALSVSGLTGSLNATVTSLITITDAVSDITNAVAGTVTELLTNVVGIVNGIFETITNTVQALADVLGKVTETINYSIRSVHRSTTVLLRTVSIISISGSASDVQATIEAVADLSLKTKGLIYSIASVAVSNSKTTANVEVEAVSSLSVVLSTSLHTIHETVEKVRSVAPNLHGDIAAILDNAVYAFSTAVKRAVDVVTDITNTIRMLPEQPGALVQAVRRYSRDLTAITAVFTECVAEMTLVLASIVIDGQRYRGPGPEIVEKLIEVNENYYNMTISETSEAANDLRYYLSL